MQSRDFVHVDDIVRGILLALESEDAVGQAVNLGTGRASTVNDIAAILADGLGLEISGEVVGKYRAGDIRHCYADTRRGEALLGFRSMITLEEGMRDLVRLARRPGSSRSGGGCHE